jgi:hypothetical protein
MRLPRQHGREPNQLLRDRREIGSVIELRLDDVAIGDSHPWRWADRAATW